MCIREKRNWPRKAEAESMIRMKKKEEKNTERKSNGFGWLLNFRTWFMLKSCPFSKYLWTSIHTLFSGSTFQSHFNWEQIYILLDSTIHHRQERRKKTKFWNHARALDIDCCQPKIFAVEIHTFTSLKRYFPR